MLQRCSPRGRWGEAFFPCRRVRGRGRGVRVGFADIAEAMHGNNRADFGEAAMRESWGSQSEHRGRVRRVCGRRSNDIHLVVGEVMVGVSSLVCVFGGGDGVQG